MKRLDELALKLLDQTIDEDELCELSELTREPNGKESFVRLMALESHLQASRRLSVEEKVVERLQQERCDRIEAGVMRTVTEPSAFVVDEVTSPFAKKSWPRLQLVIGIASLAACVLFVFLILDRNDHPDGLLARLNPHGSMIEIVDIDGNVRSVQSTDDLLTLGPNETVETSRAIDTAEIVYDDGTKVELLGETRVRLEMTTDGSKRLTVLSGLVQADVAPQPEGRPLRIVTQAATLEVLGTTLGVEVRDASTQLGVTTGRVAMTRKADGQRVEVAAGRFATATESATEPLQSHPFPILPSEWSEDFEANLPTAWRTGAFVEFENSTAVQAVGVPLSSGLRYVVTSHNAWQEGDHGLCRIDQDSVLHLRIRQSVYARITIMIGTRSYPPAPGRIGGNLFYTKKAWNETLPADTWKTISVPLSEVGWVIKQGEKRGGRAELDGLAAYLIHVSTMEVDAGLAIDRVWITHEPKEDQL